MTQEDKKLLLKDLLPRQLYGVKAHYQYYDFVGSSERLIQEGDEVIKSINLSLGNPIYIDNHHVELENIKPYLRPMSSMTEEEREEIEVFIFNEWYQENSCKIDKEGWIEILANYDVSGIDPCFCSDYVDWLNEHHFDFRGLIEKGLALEAPEGMYD